MSDASQGPGWWQAADGKWYPPESVQPAPGFGGAPAAVGYAAPKTSGLAVTSLITGILSIAVCPVIGIVGLITGSMAKRQIRESNGAETGEGIATAGIVTSIIGLVFVGVAVLAIVAITFLGEAASSKFVSVGGGVGS